jgi:hypothetical protein
VSDRLIRTHAGQCLNSVISFFIGAFLSDWIMLSRSLSNKSGKWGLTMLRWQVKLVVPGLPPHRRGVVAAAKRGGRECVPLNLRHMLIGLAAV